MLRVSRTAGFALGDDFAGVLVKRTSLGNQFNGFIELRIILQGYFETLIQAEDGGEDLALNLPLQPGEIILDFRFGVMNVLVAQVFAELVDDFFIYNEILGEVRFFAEIVAREVANALRKKVENAPAVHSLLETVGLWFRDGVVRSDSALSENLPATIGQLHFRPSWPLGIIVIIVERNILVVALDQAPAGGVVTRGGEQHSGVFAERELSLHQALTEAGFSNDQAAIVVLNGARHDFRGRGALSVDQHNDGNFQALISTQGVIAPLRGQTPVMRNHNFVLVQEHVGQTDGLVEQSAAVVAQVHDESIELGEIELLQCFRHVAVSSLVEGYDADVADSRLNHAVIFNRRAVNLVARDSNFDSLVPAFPSQRDVNHGALGPLEHLGYFGGGQAVADFPFYLQDDIAGADTGFIGRRADKWSEDHGLVVASCDGHSHAVIFSLLVFLEESVLLGVKKV